jgi:adenosylcobinamide-GDP ribazoletransferase
MLSGLVSAVRTLSLLPVPGRDATEMTRSLPWFPLVGALLGAVVYGAWRLLDAAGLSGWHQGEAVLLVLLATALTRGLHLDGLADWADGYFSLQGRKRALEIMKDPRVGTFGVIALMAVLGLKWVALTRLIEQGAAVWIVPAYVVSRTAQVELAVSLPYAGVDSGFGAAFVKDARWWHRGIAWFLAAAVLAVLGPCVPCVLIP